MNRVLAVFAVAGAAAPCMASPVQVEMRGVVEFNQARSGPVSTIRVGETLTYRFTVDSTKFLDSTSFAVRGYEIDLASFAVAASGGFSMGLADPFPAAPAYFVLRDNDPAVDGFYLTYGGVDFPGGLPTTEIGLLGDPFEAHFSAGYDGATLTSLDILDAAGSYGYGSGGAGTLTNFYFNIVDVGFEVVGIDFRELTITAVPGPGTAGVLGLAALGARRRRR